MESDSEVVRLCYAFSFDSNLISYVGNKSDMEKIFSDLPKELFRFN